MSIQLIKFPSGQFAIIDSFFQKMSDFLEGADFGKNPEEVDLPYRYEHLPAHAVIKDFSTGPIRNKDGQDPELVRIFDAAEMVYHKRFK